MEAACVTRGPVDAPKYKDYILPLIFRYLLPVEKKIEAEEKRNAALQALFKSKLHHLMTGRFA